jgi:hypothetical protein
MEQTWTKKMRGSETAETRLESCYVICHSDFAGQITYPVLTTVNQKSCKITRTIPDLAADVTQRDIVTKMRFKYKVSDIHDSPISHVVTDL